MTDRIDQLSPEARARAEAMLPGLSGELRRGVRRRAAARRISGSALALALVATIVVVAVRPTRVPHPAASGPGPATVATAPDHAPAATLVQIVHASDLSMIEIVRDGTGDGALALYAASPVAELSGVLVSDEEMLDLLRSIGRPTGLARARGRVWFTEEVTDEIGGGS